MQFFSRGNLCNNIDLNFIQFISHYIGKVFLLYNFLELKTNSIKISLSCLSIIKNEQGS